MKPRNKAPTVYKAAYIVSLDYKKPDGYWVCNHKEDFLIPYHGNETGKGLHHLAEAAALEKYAGMSPKINSVTYV